MIDKRAHSAEKLVAPAPLPVSSRRALKRIQHPAPIPTECNCCGGHRVALVENSEIYHGRSYGEWPYAYLCRDCGAYVGLHPVTDIPLGTLADKPLRDARNSCKRPFEMIWRNGAMSRKDAYAWLAKGLGIRAEECHFGLFDIERCQRARDLCNDYLEAAHA